MSSKRASIKKSSMFKLEVEKSRFKTHMEEVSNCAVMKTFPDVQEDLIKETSQSIFNYCYSHRQDSPFVRGLNYYCKEYGFSSSPDHIVTYKEYLPGAKKVYLMGDFNSFNKTSHELSLSENGHDCFEIEFNGLDLIQGSKIVLRIIDLKDKEHLMIPPSCAVVDKDHGVYVQYKKCSLPENPVAPQDILAYQISLEENDFNKTLEYLTENKQMLEKFNTIIVKKLFSSKSLFYKNTLTFIQFKKLEEILQFINIELSCKAVIQWNFCDGHQFYDCNPIEQNYITKHGQKSYKWNVSNSNVFSYVLTKISYFKTYFNIDGFLYTGLDSYGKDCDGIVLLKCLNIMNHRLSQHGITLACANNNIPGLCYNILDGGIGIMYAYNNETVFHLDENHNALYDKLKKVQPYSNCIRISLKDNITLQQNLKLLLCSFMSKKGIFFEGSLKNEQIITKVLKLRSQSQFFVNKVQILEHSQQRIIAKRGKAIVIFNFGNSQFKLSKNKINDFQGIFNLKNEQFNINNEKELSISKENCYLLQSYEQINI